jgi:hypothetical protein
MDINAMFAGYLYVIQMDMGLELKDFQHTSFQRVTLLPMIFLLRTTLMN